VLDFYCDAVKLAVEVDGGSHNAADNPQRDARRDAWLAAGGIRTLRLPARLILQDLDAATRTILAFIEQGRDAPPSGELPRSG
jgi:very-short-patch-repair endonuclease